MKITREEKFKPIHITLETEEEVKIMIGIMQKDALVPDKLAYKYWGIKSKPDEVSDFMQSIFDHLKGLR